MGDTGRRKIIDVVCAVIEEKGRVLVTRRGAGMHLEGLWEFPGGKMHEGEDERAALVREIHEELGVEVEPLRRLPDSEHDYGEKHIRLIPWVCRLVAGDIVLHEHSEFKWSEFEDLPKFDWCPADTPIVRRLIKFC
jgi:8-oxo-dGTP diphosphatase